MSIDIDSIDRDMIIRLRDMGQNSGEMRYLARADNLLRDAVRRGR